MRLLLSVLLLLAVTACDTTKENCRKFIGPTQLSPAGYTYAWHKVGTAEDVAPVLDTAVEKAIMAHVTAGADEAWVRAVAAGHVYLVDDSAYFLATDNRSWAVGEWVSHCDLIKVSYYSIGQTRDQSAIPSDSPAWTVSASPIYPGVWWYANVAGERCPAMRHELGHALYGPCFEHPCSGL